MSADNLLIESPSDLEKSASTICGATQPQLNDYSVLSANSLIAESPRETMFNALPQFMQPALTSLTGQPFKGEVARQRTPWHHLGTSVLAHVVGVIGTALCVTKGGMAWIAVPLTTLFALHGARKLRNVIMHQCAHDNFIGHRSFDRLLGKAISVAFLTDEFDLYKRSHIEDHHSSRHQTILDPTVVFLFRDLGLRPQMKPREMWRRLLLTTISPFYHLRFFYERISSHFRATSLRHKICFIAYLLVLGGTVIALDVGAIFIWSWLLPVSLLYQISTAFRMCGRHVFLPTLPDTRGKTTLGAFTIGIFVGAACPRPDSNRLRNAGEWIWWWIRMLIYHIPCRLAVLVGDAPAHDYHHRFPRAPDWANFLYVRASDKGSPGEGWPLYREVWGMHQAINATFRSLSTTNPTDYPYGALSANKAARMIEE